MGALLAATLLLIAACDEVFFPLGSPKVVYLVPENFSGWVCMDFDIEGAPPLSREGKAVVIRARPGTVLQTSESDDGVALKFPVEALVETNGSRRRLPDGMSVRREVGRSGPNEPTQRTCRFIGTVDQEDAAGDPPGFEGRFATGPVSADERAALVALFESTEGPKWIHRVGWLGSPGTECRWHGVRCGQRDDGRSSIIGLDLTGNNLRGAIPKALSGLEDLESLDLHGNQLTGRLPDALVQRWASGKLWVFGHQSSWLTDVSEIALEYSSTGSIGARHRILLSVDGHARVFAERLLGTSCEVREGQISPDDFARLANFIERSGYYSLQTEYHRSITHAAFETTSVTRNGRAHTVRDYASAGPLALWTIRQAITGLAESATRKEVTRQATCPAPLAW
jgi:hypothetical protein